MSAQGETPRGEGPAEIRDFVTMTIGGQVFGVPVLAVQDVLSVQRITRIPLAPPEVAGALNLRGRIVTAIDMRRRLGMAARDAGAPAMSVVVEHGGELFSLMVDAVGEVLSLSGSAFENNPPTLSASWREVSMGVYRLQERLLVVLDVARVIETKRSEAA